MSLGWRLRKPYNQFLPAILFVVEIVFDIIPLSVLVRKKFDPFGGETKHELTAFDNVVLQLVLLRRRER